MTLLSYFMTSAGIFCFVPIWHRLVESGIMIRRRQRVPFVIAFHAPSEEMLRSLATDDIGIIWLDVEVILCSEGDFLATDKQPATSYAEKEWNTGATLSRERSPTRSLLHPGSFDSSYSQESGSIASFCSDRTLCNSCNTLLNGEIPADHIPSVIRAFALFEAQKRLSDVDFSESDVVDLTNTFSMLRL